MAILKQNHKPESLCLVFIKHYHMLAILICMETIGYVSKYSFEKIKNVVISNYL